MSVTAENLIDEVAVLVGDSSTKFKEKLLVGLKQVLRRIPAFLYHDKIFTVWATSLGEGEEEITLTDNITNVKAVKVKDGNSWFEVKRVRLEDLNYGTTARLPSKFAVEGNKILFDAPADKEYYLRLVVATSNASNLSWATEFDFTDEVLALIHDGLLYEAYMYRERPDMANTALNSFTATLRAILEMYEEDNVGNLIWQEE